MANRLQTVLRVVLGVGFVFFGALKFVKPEVHAENFAIFPAFVMPLTGIAEAALGIALLGKFQTRLAAYALALIMAGAVYSHIVVGLDPRVVPSILLGLLSLLLGYKAGESTQSTAGVAPHGK